MPRKQPRPGSRPLSVDDFPDELRDRLHVVAAQQKTTARAIIIGAVTEAVLEREKWQRQERDAAEPGVMLRDGWHPAQ